MSAQRRRSKVVTAIVLCCLAGTLLIAPNGLLDAPRIALAAEKAETPTQEPDPGETGTDAPAQSEASKNAKDDPPGNAPSESDADASEEIFVPSEDISEDIDVPFPVDI